MLNSLALSGWYPVAEQLAQLRNHATQKLGMRPEALGFVFVLSERMTFAYLCEEARVLARVPSLLREGQTFADATWREPRCLFITDPVSVVTGCNVVHRASLSDEIGLCLQPPSDLRPASQADIESLRKIYSHLACDRDVIT